MGTEFPQKVRVKGITNPSLIEYMTARVKKGWIVIALVEKVSQKISLTPNHIKSFCQKFLINDKVLLSSRGGLEVEQWSDNRTLSISVDQSPLWALNIVFLDCDIGKFFWLKQQ